MSIPIDISEESGVRYLHFGSDWVQGAMRMRKPNALELTYTREMMAGLLFREAPWPARVLLIGLGAGSLAKFVHHHLPDASVTVVEIAPEVHAVARQYFRLPDEGERFEVHVGDGAEFIQDDPRQWDLIAVDGFDRHARAGALATQPFYAACRARLAADGVLSVNLFGQLRGFKTQLQRLRKAFDGRVLDLPECDSGNVVALASPADGQSFDLATLKSRAANLKTVTGLDLLPTLRRLEKSGACLDGSVSL